MSEHKDSCDDNWGNNVIILVVDDDPFYRINIKELLMSRGFSVRLGVDGEDGWREFCDSKPKIVVTDCHMETRYAGLELVRKIKEYSPQTITILFTADPDVDFCFWDLSGVNIAIYKTPDCEELIAVIDLLIQKLNLKKG